MSQVQLLLSSPMSQKQWYLYICFGTIASDVSEDRLFLHDWTWISLWIKSISNELEITCHVLSSQLSGHCDIIANQLWRHQQSVKRASETRGWCVKILVLKPFMDSLCHVRNKIMSVHLWRTVYALTWVLFWCLFLINTKITLLWAYKQLPTRVHTLFSIYGALWMEFIVSW